MTAEIPASLRTYGHCLRWGGVGLILAAIGSMTSRAMNPLPVSALSTPALTTVYLAALASGTGALWLRGYLLRTHTTPSPAPAAVEVEHAPSPPCTAPPIEPSPEPFIEEPFLRRVSDVLSEDQYVVVSSATFDTDSGECLGFAIRTRKPGTFASAAVQKTLYERITESVGGKSKWTMDPVLTDDRLDFARKAAFPRLIAPPLPPHVAASASDALDTYPDVRLNLGVTANNDVLSIDLSKFPHFLFVGGTGSGKSVFNRGVIELFRAAGWMIVLIDGKGTDYSLYRGQPNIVAVSQTVPDHLRITKLVSDELIARRHDANQILRKGDRDGGSAFRRPPLLLLIDEFATIKTAVKNLKSDFESDLEFLTRVGRQFRVHVGIATQELYRDTVSGKLLGNLPLIVSLGPPADKTIKEAFPEALRAEASRVGGTISKNDRGRALALFTPEDGNNSVVEFQSYYSYSPGDPDPSPAPLAEQHEIYRTQVSERVPKLYPRLWFAVDDENYGDVVEDLYALPPVMLDRADGTPDPEAVQYDPLSDSYNGEATADQPAIPAFAELADGSRTFQPKRPSRVRTARSDDLDDDTTYLPPGTAPLNHTYTPPPSPRHAAADDHEQALDEDGDAADTVHEGLDDEADDPPWNTDDPEPLISRPPPPRRRNTGGVNL